MKSEPLGSEPGRDWIESEVRRLSPWYYRFDLRGVRTDSTPPCDYLGHREVHLPGFATSVLQGKSLLDVACNEGGYTFAALERGAASVHGFDVRAVNIEKARLVARVRGDANVSFEVASTDTYLEAHPTPHDVVFLCGLLYHVAAPWQTIADYCRLAREAVFVTCVLHGGEDGYTPFPEQENIAASRDAEPSTMPNTTRTLIDEFAKHGFLPRYIGESRSENHWGGCSLLFQSTGTTPRCADDRRSERVELQVLPPAAGTDAPQAEAVVYNWTEHELELEGWVTHLDKRGNELAREGPQPIRLPPRVSSARSKPSESRRFDVTLTQLPGAARLVFELKLAGSSEVLATRTLAR